MKWHFMAQLWTILADLLCAAILSTDQKETSKS